MSERRIRGVSEQLFLIHDSLRESGSSRRLNPRSKTFTKPIRIAQGRLDATDGVTETSARVLWGGLSLNQGWVRLDPMMVITHHNTHARATRFPIPECAEVLRRLDQYPVSRSTIGCGYGMPRNVKVVRTFKQLVKSSQLACHGPWQPETTSVSTPAARRPVGPRRPRIASRVYRLLGIRTVLPVGLSAKDLDGNETSLMNERPRDGLRIHCTELRFWFKRRRPLRLSSRKSLLHQSLLV